MILTALLMGALAGPAMLPAMADASPGFRVVDLGMGDFSEATAINDFGHVVGHRGSGRPFLWRDGQVTELLPDGEYGLATDINNRDEVVGTRNGRAFLWSRGVLTDLGTLPGGGYSSAAAINDRGEVVGSSGTATSVHAFRWRDGLMTDLGALPGEWSRSFANDINNAGVAVGESGVMEFAAIRWPRDGTMQQLTDVGSGAKSINDHGDITGTSSGGVFVWHRDAFTYIPRPSPTWFMWPNAINNKMEVVGFVQGDAFLWHHGQLTMLPRLADLTTGANDINDHGQIAGFSAAGLGGMNYHAVIWTR
jgi:probable HAF family extracellular repeat protein